MTLAFWYWFMMLIWFLCGGKIFYGKRAELATIYWGIGFSLFLFILLVILGAKVFPDPFGTLVKD